MDDMVEVEQELCDLAGADYHYIDAFRVVQKAGRSDYDKAKAVSAFIAHEVASAITKARIAEREACAKVAERTYAQDAFRFELNTATAEAIRNRGRIE